MQHSPDDCTVCRVISANPDLSNSKLGSLVGVGESTVRRHKGVTSLPETFFTDIPKEIITSRGRSVRTPEGSWEKITYRPQDLALHESLKYEDISDYLKTREVESPATSRGAGQTEIFSFADPQFGKAMETGGGTKETVERVMTSRDNFVARCKKTNPSEIVVTDLGDIIENIWNVPNHQLTTNDLDLTSQIRVARRALVDLFLPIAPLARKVYFVGVPSNHGQVRNAPGSSLGSVDNDLGLEIGYQVEDIFKDSKHKALRRVEFVRPEPLQETAVLETSGTRIAFNHGHRSRGGVHGHDAWWMAQDHGRMPGWDADILNVAHYHSLFLEHSGNGRWIIGSSASEPSSDYFALATGKRSKRGVTCYSVSNKTWSNLEIL